jgi:hypothetical protein
MVLWTASAPPAHAQPASARPAPKVDLYTMGPGEDIFAHFGHGALCVLDQNHPNGLCYNYGTTNFKRPWGLIWDVLHGQSEFWVEPVPLPRMLKSYERQDRTLYRQRLPLTDDQARLLAARLAHDALPEHRNYVYHHFASNCTTPVRDHLDVTFGGKLKRATDKDEGDNWRIYVREGFVDSLGLLLLSELILGRELEHPRTRWDAMFLPRVLREELTQELGVQPEIIYARRGPPFEGNKDRAPWIFAAAGLLVGALASLGAWRGGPKVARYAQRAAAVWLGFFAFWVFLAATLSSEPELRHNELLLVFAPTDLVCLALRQDRRRAYALARLASLALVPVLVGLGWFVQPLWGAWLLAVSSLVAFVVPRVGASPAPSAPSDPPKLDMAADLGSH